MAEHNQTPKGPEDIFASNDKPSARPVLKKAQESTPLVTREPHRDTSSKRVMKLMIVVIVMVLAGGVAYALFQYSKNVPTNIVEAPIIQEEEVDLIGLDVINSVSEPEEIDTDADGLSDVREIELGLDPNRTDTDGDLLSDKDEVDIYLTDPFNPDSDGDGFSDGQEVRQGFNPLGPGTLTQIPQ